MVDARMVIYPEAPYMARCSYVGYGEPFSTECRANGDVESIAKAAKVELERRGVVITEVHITEGQVIVSGALEVKGEVVEVGVVADGGSLLLTTRIEFRADYRDLRVTVQKGQTVHDSLVSWATHFLPRTGTVEVDGPAVAVTPA